MTLDYYIADQEFVEGKVMVVKEKSWSDALQDAFLTSKATHLRFRYSLGWDQLDFSFLKELPPNSVEGIQIDMYKAVDVSPLSHLTSLKLISLELNKNMPDILIFQNLEALLLKYKKSISDFVKLPKLKHIYMKSLPGVDFSMLSEMTQLQSLTLLFGKQISVNGLQHLPNLTFLKLYRLKHLQDWNPVIGSVAAKNINIEKCGAIEFASGEEDFLKALGEIKTNN